MTTSPRPFEVDPDVMAAIRPMQYRDVDAVIALHAKAMGDSLWAKLGWHFLRELYRGLHDNPHFLAFVFEDDDLEVRGFIAGSTDASTMMREVFKERGLVMGFAAVPGVLRSPGVLRHLLATGRYFNVSDDPDTDIPAESLFCSFDPEFRGKRVAGHINKVLFDDLLARGHRYVKITTEVDNVGANRQLQSWGFQDKGRFTFYGKEMVRYVLDLQASDRVEPVSRHPTV